MKILHVITDLYTGGAERALVNLLAAGLADRFDTHVLNLREETSLSRDIAGMGIPVINLGLASAIDAPAALWRLHQLANELQPTVIQGWMYHGNLAATLMNKKNSVLIWNIRQTLYSLSYEKFMTAQVIRANRWLSARPGKILYNSRLSREQHELFGFSDSQAQVIPNGINLDNYTVMKKPGQRVRDELNINPDAFVFGHVARFHPMKGHGDFVHSAVRVAKSQPQTEFILVGEGITSENHALISLIPDTLLSRFHFLGERRDIPEVMQSCNVLCLSSLYGEAFPNVLGEAMATGLPCVVTDVGDCPDILGDAGIVVPPGDQEAFCVAMLNIASMSTDQRIALGEVGRSRVEKYYALNNIVKQYIDLYTSFQKKTRNA